MKGETTNPRAAYYAPTERIAPHRSAGRVAAFCRKSYPPGVPWIAYGDVLDDALAARLADGCTAKGEPGGVAVVPCDGVRVRTWQAEALPEAERRALADLFRETFSNAPYGQYAWDEETNAALSWSQVHGFDAGYVPLARLDGTAMPGRYPRFMDPGVTQRRLAERLRDPGVVALAHERATGRLMGAVHVRAAALERLFATEDWGFADQWRKPRPGQPEPRPRDPARFLRLARARAGLEPGQRVVTVSAQMVRPEARHGRVLSGLMSAAAAAVPPDWGAMPLISESLAGSPAHALNRSVHERCIHGMLDSGHSLLFCARASSALWYFEGDGSRFRAAVRRAVADRRRGFVAQASDHPSVAVRDVPGKGQGVFATAAIPRGSTVARFTGERYEAEAASAVPAVMRDHCIQVGARSFVHAEGRLAEKLNHSCQPNCGISGVDTLFAARDIAAGEELVWDYRCSEDSDWRLDACACGSAQCTGSVAGWSSLSGACKHRYRSLGLVSDWIAEREGWARP